MARLKFGSANSSILTCRWATVGRRSFVFYPEGETVTALREAGSETVNKENLT